MGSLDKREMGLGFLDGRKAMTKFTLGQKVWIDRSNFFRSTKPDANMPEGIVTKVGRKWITISEAGWIVERFDPETLRIVDQGATSPARVWLSPEDREAFVEASAAWTELQRLVSKCHRVPEHLSADDVRQLIAALSSATLSEQSEAPG